MFMPAPQKKLLSTIKRLGSREVWILIPIPLTMAELLAFSGPLYLRL